VLLSLNSCLHVHHSFISHVLPSYQQHHYHACFSSPPVWHGSRSQFPGITLPISCTFEFDWSTSTDICFTHSIFPLPVCLANFYYYIPSFSTLVHGRILLFLVTHTYPLPYLPNHPLCPPHPRTPPPSSTCTLMHKHARAKTYD